MVTVLRESGFRFVIFTDDHEPAHVHVYGDGEAKIQLVGRQGEPELVWMQRMKSGDVRKAMAIVFRHRSELLARWRQMHA
jgi:hypothetical protein